MPFPVTPLFAGKPSHPFVPLVDRTAGAHSEGQGRPSAGACALPLTEASTLAGWRRSGNRMASRCAILLLAAALAVCAGTGNAVAQTAPIAGPAVADPYAAHIAEAAKRFAIPARWIRAVMAAESTGDRAALSPKGAMGLMQIMPATWSELRARHRLGSDPWLPRDNVLAGAAYLREMHDRYGTIKGMLAAYNAGPTRYDEHLARGRALPAETVDYIAKVMPMIDGKVAIAPSGIHRSRPSWSRAPLFAGRSNVQSEDDPATANLPSGRPSDTRTIVDLSALAPPSDGLFVRRPETKGVRR